MSVGVCSCVALQYLSHYLLVLPHSVCFCRAYAREVNIGPTLTGQLPVACEYSFIRNKLLFPLQPAPALIPALMPPKLKAAIYVLLNARRCPAHLHYACSLLSHLPASTTQIASQAINHTNCESLSNRPINSKQVDQQHIVKLSS